MGRCGIVVGRCGSLWVVPGFSNYVSIIELDVIAFVATSANT